MKSFRIKKLRFLIQISVLLIIFSIILNSSGVLGKLWFWPDVSTHNLCPMGGVETLSTLITQGSFLPKIHSATLLLFGIGILISLLFGAVFCGFICPLGSVQEWLGKLGHKLFSKKYNYFFPARLDKVLRYLRYPLLVIILIQTISTGKLFFESYDPYYALMNFYNSEVAITAWVILGLTLLASLFVERPFCKYACPYGAVQAIVSQGALFKVRRQESTCINCKLCDKACPMSIPISQQKTVRGHHCIACFKCVSGEACPQPETLIISTPLNTSSKRITHKEASHET